MLRLCYLTRSCSRKQNHFTLTSYMLQIQNFSSIEHPCDTAKCTPTDVGQFKPWKRVNKNSPLIKNLLQMPDFRHLVSLLADIMDCDETVIRELISRDSCLLTMKALVAKVKLLKENGFSANDIVSNPSALHRSLAFLQKRFQTVKSMPWPDAVTLHSIIQSDKVFEQFIERNRNDFKAMEGFVSREQFLANLFHCDEDTITVLLTTNKLLESISPALISSKMCILTDKFEISHRFVRENSKILFHTSVLELEKRLTLLSEKQLLPPNSCDNLSYLLSCSCEEFSKSFSYTYKRKKALDGCKNKLEYLCFRLKCSESAAKYFLSSPHMQKMSEIKLRQMLDFLLIEIKMEADFVLKHRELLIYSVTRIRKRWTVLCDAGYRDVTLLPSVAVLTDKQFSAKYGSCVFIDTFTDHS